MAKKKETIDETTKKEKNINNKKEKNRIDEKKQEKEKNNVSKIKEVEKEQEENAVTTKEEMVSIKEIKKTIKNKQNLPKEEIEKINKYLFQNILVAICIIIYFIFLNLGKMNIQTEIYETDLKVFSMCILLFAIALIEKAYKKDDGKIAIYGIEMIVLSLVTTALIYVNLMLSMRYVYIVTSISYIFAIYYLIKSVIIYIRGRKKYFVDDMKEIIKNKEE